MHARRSLFLSALFAVFAASGAPARCGGASPFPSPGAMLVGVNYRGSKAGVRMWRADEWDEASVEKDIASLADIGVEVMRVFPTWSEFQPLAMERKYQCAPALVLREGSDEEIYDNRVQLSAIAPKQNRHTNTLLTVSVRNAKLHLFCLRDKYSSRN